MDDEKKHYRIVIVGGGIAGLSLASMCEKLDIRYILLEGRDTLESDRGAGVGLQPNGFRILDQLGLMQNLEEATVPIHKWFSYDGDGNLMSTSEAMGHFRQAVGYPIAMFDRPKLLSIMAGHIRRWECLKTSARVVSIHETDDHVVVTTANGVSYTADVVVGADGVRSVVRSHIDSLTGTGPGDDSFKVRYSAVYGVSAPTKGMGDGDRFVVHREQLTAVGFAGKNGNVYWFVFEDLGKSMSPSEALQHTQKDAETTCQAVAHLQITPQLTFGELFKNRHLSIKAVLEEGIAKTWHTDRAVIVGDAACKMTPAGGQGANSAIEASAVLINRLAEVFEASDWSPSGSLQRAQVRAALEKYAQERLGLARISLERSWVICKGLFNSADPMVQAMTKMSDRDQLLRFLDGFAGAPVLERVPLTERGQHYNMGVRAAQDVIKRHQQEEQRRAAAREKRQSMGRL